MSRCSSESQDDTTSELRSKIAQQLSSETPEADVELRNSRFKVSLRNEEAQHSQGLKRSISSIDVPRHLSEQGPRHLQRTVSYLTPRPRPPSLVTKAEILKNNFASKNGNMVLQLVLPSNNSHVDGDNYFNNNSVEDILGNNPNKLQSVSSQQDLYSTVGAESYINQGFTEDLAEYGRTFAAQTPISESSSDNQNQSTCVEVKKQTFRKHLTNILSSMYALFIVTMGLVIYISDVVLAEERGLAVAEAFNLYLVIVALAFILYVTVDIKLYVNKKNRYNELLKKNVAREIELKESPSGDFQLNISLPEAVKFRRLEHFYCFSKDRHSANFYLKIGAAGFCIGHLIHSGLLLGYQILFLATDGDSFYQCATTESLVLDIMYPIYSFFLLYFIFKYSNIIINRHVDISRFALMHCISTSLCFWIWTILRETVESLSNHDYETSTEAPLEVAFFKSFPVALPLTAYNKRGAKVLKEYINSSLHEFVGECGNDSGMSTIYRNYSPYLYPFTVEYSILVVGVLFVIWQSIGKCKDKEEMSTKRQCDTPEQDNDNLESNIVIHADCHSANKGLFSGIVIMVLTVVSVILFLIAVNDVRYKDDAVYINVFTTILIIFLMTVTSIFAYRQITKLDVNNISHISLLDDLLLFVCIPAFFLNGIVAIIPAFEMGNPASITSIILEVVQVLVQTPLIIDGLKRCSNTKTLQRGKPGRELLTFLIVCNVAMWIMQTFEVKSHGLQDNRHEFYGAELWTIIGHLCVPLMMFYRFHSSVCIVDIWKYAYEPADH